MLRAVRASSFDPARVRSYLAVAARRLACDVQRLRRREERLRWRLSTVGEARSPEDIVWRRGQAQALMQAVQALPLREREVLLASMHGMSVGEVSAALRISYKSAESALGRARRKMRAQAWDTPELTPERRRAGVR